MDGESGHEADVAPIFAKLTEESRKEPGCLMYQVHRHKTEPRRFFIYEQYKDEPRLKRTAALASLSCSTPAKSCQGCGPRGRASVRTAGIVCVRWLVRNRRP